MPWIFIIFFIITGLGLLWAGVDTWSRDVRGVALHQHKYRMRILFKAPYWECTKSGCSKCTWRVSWPWGVYEEE